MQGAIDGNLALHLLIILLVVRIMLSLSRSLRGASAACAGRCGSFFPSGAQLFLRWIAFALARRLEKRPLTSPKNEGISEA